MRTPPQNPRLWGNFPAAAKGRKGVLETVVFVCKLKVVVFKTVVLFETILGRNDDATDPVTGNERECICIRTLSRFERRLRRTKRALKRGEGKKGTQRLFRDE
jgi:hypothetical protein